ncbi:hypothetical protein Hdeb2414_s0062g00764241 [Helianthus debilis subsp. tardiflorus]
MECNVELQERTSMFRKQANAIVEWDMIRFESATLVWWPNQSNAFYNDTPTS